MEVWKPIDGYPHYEVSNLGRVRSWRPRNGRGLALADEPRVLKAIPFSGRPYLKVALTDLGGHVSHKRVHRLVLSAFVGPCPEGLEGCHNDGDPSNNALTNLRWNTKGSNFEDQIKHGTRRKGERHPRSAISDEARADILASLSHLSGNKRRDKTGLVKRLAEEHGVTAAMIYNLRRRANDDKDQDCGL